MNTNDTNDRTIAEYEQTYTEIRHLIVDMVSTWVALDSDMESECLTMSKWYVEKWIERFIRILTAPNYQIAIEYLTYLPEAGHIKLHNDIRALAEKRWARLTD